MKRSPLRMLVETVAHPLYSIYSTSDRDWDYTGLRISVSSGVFHPGWFVTSRMLLEKLERMDVSGKQFLELGCGTGTQACRAAAKGAKAYASDITAMACKNTALNASANGLEVTVLQSDIFESFDAQLSFDVIFVNPPFILQYPEEERDFAFFCGEQLEYYHALFESLDARLKPDGELIMALAKSCPYEEILEICSDYGFTAERVDRNQRWGETNYLFTIRHEV